jgi:SAM-dependent methyltransferase
VEFLAGLAGGGRVLELAIGTGRVALPLASRGITIEGVDASAAMVARLRAKPGGEQIPVTIGDLADVPARGPFWLVYLVFNTLFNLLSADRQADCFRQGIRLLPVAQRHSWPSELDLMAGQAGLRLRERYADWDRRPFGSDSANHVSVYRPG